MAAEIDHRPLGRTGLMVSALGFGSAPLGDLYTHLDEREAVDAAVAAATGGITLFDTSPLYGHGLAEHRLGTALRRVDRNAIVLSTKVGRWMSPARGAHETSGYAGGLPFAATIDYSFDGAMRSIEQSLLRLGVSHVEIALIHDVDRRNHGDALDARIEEAVTGAWRALAKLRGEGVIRAAGIGVNEADVCVRFAERCDIDCVLLAGRYTLLDQSAADEFLPLALERGIGVMAGGVFNSGVLATGPVAGAKFDYAAAPPEILARTRRLAAICARHDVALPTAAIHFARLHPSVSSVVLGAVSPAEVERNLASWRASPPPDLWQELKGERLIPDDTPTSGEAR
jgi:D-threo-aldose 1-dehydrogenase